VGSEGRGVSDRLRAKSMDVRIPTVGVESLNAALAAGIALYAARKQRMVSA
jgi:RNA methyltransferase, TrmH family